MFWLHENVRNWRNKMLFTPKRMVQCWHWQVAWMLWGESSQLTAGLPASSTPNPPNQSAFLASLPASNALPGSSLFVENTQTCHPKFESLEISFLALAKALYISSCHKTLQELSSTNNCWLLLKQPNFQNKHSWPLKFLNQVEKDIAMHCATLTRTFFHVNLILENTFGTSKGMWLVCPNSQTAITQSQRWQEVFFCEPHEEAPGKTSFLMCTVWKAVCYRVLHEKFRATESEYLMPNVIRYIKVQIMNFLNLQRCMGVKVQEVCIK